MEYFNCYGQGCLNSAMKQEMNGDDLSMNKLRKEIFMDDAYWRNYV